MYDFKTERIKNFDEGEFVLCADYSPIYQTLLSLNESILPTFLPVRRLPTECEEADCVMLSNDQKTDGLLIVLGGTVEEMQERIIRYYQSEKRPVYSYGPDLLYETCHKMRDLYECALELSQILHINLPLFFLVKNEYLLPHHNAYRFTLCDEKNKPENDFIALRKRGKNYMLFSLAHELRHCWQDYVSEDDIFYKNYSPPWSTTITEYEKQPEEIDAEAFAVYYMEKYHHLQNVFHFMYDDAEAEEQWKWHADLIRKRKTIIPETLNNSEYPLAKTG